MDSVEANASGGFGKSNRDKAKLEVLAVPSCKTARWLKGVRVWKFSADGNLRYLMFDVFGCGSRLIGLKCLSTSKAPNCSDSREQMVLLTDHVPFVKPVASTLQNACVLMFTFLP